MNAVPSGCALRAHDPSEFETRVRPHLVALHAAARRVLRSDDLAWDAVQETLVALWREPDAPPELRGWLVRTVLHKSLHLERARRRRGAHERAAGIAPDQPCPLCGPADGAGQVELEAAFEAAMRELPAPMRRVFLLRARDGLEYAEIADRLRLPPGTVRSRLRRARTHLAAFLRVAEPLRHEEAFVPARAARTL